MRRSILIAVALALLAAAAAAAWLVWGPARVSVEQPARGMALEAVYATGTVEPTVEIRIAPRVAGRLVELHADEGDVVRKGALLARLEDVDLKAQVAELQARVELTAADHRRNLELRRTGMVSQAAVDRSRTDLEAAQAAVRRAREQVGFTRLLAPDDGRIIRRDGEVGEYIPVNQALFYMAAEGPLRITAEVDEEDVPRVQPGQDVLIHSDAFPGQVFAGRVDQITPRGDTTARSYRVRIALTGHPPLAIGMTTETNIVIDRRAAAPRVPTTAVVDAHVWVVENERARRVAVTTGVAGPQRTEIRAGLPADAYVIAQPPEHLEDGARVDAHRQPAAARADLARP